MTRQPARVRLNGNGEVLRLHLPPEAKQPARVRADGHGDSDDGHRDNPGEAARVRVGGDGTPSQGEAPQPCGVRADEHGNTGDGRLDNHGEAARVRADGDGNSGDVRLGGHGEAARVREDGDGDIWVQVQRILPDLATHGYILVSGNATKVWLALLVHALAHGAVAADDARPPRPSHRKKPMEPASRRAAKPKSIRKPRPISMTRPKTRPKPKASPRSQATAKMVRLEAEWDNGSLSRVTNLKHTAVHAAQNELIVLGWMTKQSARNSQGQFGGFRYALHKPPAALPDAAKQRYETKLNDLFGRAYELQHLLDSAVPESVSGDCPLHADLFALASGRLGDGDGKKMVVEEHLRGCRGCQQRLKDIIASEQEWGG